MHQLEIATMQNIQFHNLNDICYCMYETYTIVIPPVWIYEFNKTRWQYLTQYSLIKDI